MKDHLFLALVLCLCTSHHVPSASSFEMDNIGRVVRGHLGTLYDLRSKLNSGPTTSERPVVPQPPLHQSASSASRRYSQRVVEIRTEAPLGVTKESRGYAYHYSPTDVKNPIYSQDFQSSKPSRSSKSSSSASSSGKWKRKGEKDWDKYVKRVQQDTTTTAQYQPEPTTTTWTTTTIPNTPAVVVTPEAKLKNLPLAVPEPATPTLSFPSFGSVGPFATFTQGLNHAMTTVLTQKLMNIIDQDAPQGILKPMRDVVATGGRMIEYWDKRTNARDGKNPGILELMGFGMDQLKKFKDGSGELKKSDVVTSNTTPSKTLIEGLVTIKKLTNRVLGYDTDMEAVMMESRDGHGGGGGHGWGWGGGGGHHVSYGGHSNHLDPFSLLAALAFGAFLLQLLLTLYNTSARSLDVTDINTPLLMSDYYMPKIMSAADKIFGTPTVRTKRSADGDEEEDDSTFGSIIDKLDGLFKSYNHVSEKPKCIRLYMCRLAVQDVMGDANSVLSRLYMYGLEHLTSDKSTKDFIESIQDKVIAGENVDCSKEVRDCMPNDILDT